MMTELYLEQVLIGALGMSIALLPWLADIQNQLRGIDAGDAVAVGSAALGVAFWLGIPLDRFADTLTDRLERHARLRFALKRGQGTAFPAKKCESSTLERDLFAEDRLRVSALRDSEAAVKWVDYHRSRIRLTRALAVYGPALAVSLAIGLTRARELPLLPVNPDWLTAIAFGYATWAILARLRELPPRTTDAGFRTYAERWGFVKATDPQIVKTNMPDALLWASEVLTLAVPLALLGAALVKAFSAGDTVVELATVAVAVMTTVSAWAWWRIGFTFRTYLDDLEKYSNKSKH